MTSSDWLPVLMATALTMSCRMACTEYGTEHAHHAVYTPWYAYALWDTYALHCIYAAAAGMVLYVVLSAYTRVRTFMARDVENCSDWGRATP